MLPPLYQMHLETQLNDLQLTTLEMLLNILQKERRVTIERLATLFAQPIEFESRRRGIQRFLKLPQLSIKALWFPILERWLQSLFKSSHQVKVLIDRTQWQDHNLLMVSIAWKKRAIPVYWELLDKRGASNLDEQQSVLKPVFQLLKNYRVVVLADREFHSVHLADWLGQQRVQFALRLHKSTTVQLEGQSEFQRLDQLDLHPGMKRYEVKVQVTQQRGFGQHSVAMRWKRVRRDQPANEAWYILTNLDTLEAALALYRQRFQIEGMFRDFKSGGYNLEDCRASTPRFLAIVLVVAMAYCWASFAGEKIRHKGVQRYVGRTRSTRTTQRHSLFWIGLYGWLWIDGMNLWSDLAQRLMRLKPHKLPYYQRGLRAMALIQSAF